MKVGPSEPSCVGRLQTTACVTSAERSSGRSGFLMRCCAIDEGSSGPSASSGGGVKSPRAALVNDRRGDVEKVTGEPVGAELVIHVMRPGRIVYQPTGQIATSAMMLGWRCRRSPLWMSYSASAGFVLRMVMSICAFEVLMCSFLGGDRV